MRRTAAVFAVFALAATLRVAPASAAPFLSISEAKAAIFAIIEPKKTVVESSGIRIAFTDWNVRSCFRLAENKVQCRWSLAARVTDSDSSKRVQCFGNARAIKTTNGVKAKRLGLPSCPALGF